MRQHAAQHVPGTHPAFVQRQTLAADWNGLVRRWYPKRTDFSKCTRADMRRLEHVVNSIHRRLLGGKTAYEYDTAHAKAA